MIANNPQPSVLKNLAMDLIIWFKLATTELAETGASNRIGQAIIKQADKALWMVEKSSQWSQPPVIYKKDENVNVSNELTRPLPWIFFLPMLMMLRFIRESLSIGALIMGKEPIKPQTIIKYIQNIRRSLRAIKYQGIRNMRMNSQQLINQREIIANASIWTRWFYKFVGKIKSMLYFKSVKYSSSQNRQLIIRKTEGETALVNKKEPTKKRKSPDDLEDNVTILRDFVSKIDEYLESDSDDTDFSLVEEKSDQNSETSCTSEDDLQEAENDNSGDKQVESTSGVMSSEKPTNSSEVVAEVNGSVSNNVNEPKTENGIIETIPQVNTSSPDEQVIISSSDENKNQVIVSNSTEDSKVTSTESNNGDIIVDKTAVNTSQSKDIYPGESEAIQPLALENSTVDKDTTVIQASLDLLKNESSEPELVAQSSSGKY